MNKETKLRIKVLAYAKGQLKITDGKTVKITTRQIIYNLVQAGKIEIVMPKCLCVSKVRSKQGIITHYRVSDAAGNSKLVEKNKFKELIYNYMLDCINLTLTQDNRLVVKGIPDDDGTQGKENRTQGYRNKSIVANNDNNSIIPIAVETEQETVQIKSTAVGKSDATPIFVVEAVVASGNDSNGSSDTDDQQDTWDIQNWSSNYNSQNIANTRNTKALLGISYKELNDLTKKLGLRVQA